jgi:hypothetical protein
LNHAEILVQALSVNLSEFVCDKFSKGYINLAPLGLGALPLGSWLLIKATPLEVKKHENS